MNTPLIQTPVLTRTIQVPVAGFTRDGDWGTTTPVSVPVASSTAQLDAVSPSVAQPTIAAPARPKFVRLTADEQLYGKVSIADAANRDWARLAKVYDGS